MRNKIIVLVLVAFAVFSGFAFGRVFSTFEELNNELSGSTFVEIISGEKDGSIRIIFQPDCPAPFQCVNKTLVIADVNETDLSLEY